MTPAADTPSWAAHLPAGATPAALDLVADGSLPARWIRRWAERPAWPQLRDTDGRWLSSAELEESTRLLARRLRAGGLVPGERLVLSADSSAALITTYIAALRAGLVVVPLNTAYTRREVERIVGAARPAGAAVDSDERASWIAGALEAPVPVFALGSGPAPASASDTGSRTDSLAGIDDAGTDDPALLLFTSGTTGQPKGALLTHGNLLASATAVNLAWRWEPDDQLLLTLPLFHLHGLGVGVNGSLAAGAAIVLRSKFDPDDVADHAGGGLVSMFFGVPAMYQRLAATGRAADLNRLRLLVSGSAPLPSALSLEVSRQAGQTPLERYGMTETVMLTANPYDGPRKPGTVGLPLPGVEVRLSEVGEVEVHGPNVIAGYHDNPTANAEAFTRDGWFKTGDLGAFDEDGYLRLVGRSKELIITGGFNVHPREVEEALATHPNVAEVAVVGRPSEQWGEAVTAVVVTRSPVDAQELRAYAARQLAPYKVPKDVEFTDELPRNALGKVIRRQL